VGARRAVGPHDGPERPPYPLAGRSAFALAHPRREEARRQERGMPRRLVSAMTALARSVPVTDRSLMV
jgi:hypothetical protein